MRHGFFPAQVRRPMPSETTPRRSHRLSDIRANRAISACQTVFEAPERLGPYSPTITLCSQSYISRMARIGGPHNHTTARLFRVEAARTRVEPLHRARE